MRQGKLEYSLDDVESILCEFASMEYSRMDFSNCENPDYINDHIEQTEDDLIRHKLKWSAKWCDKFINNNPQMFGYIWSEEQEEWIMDSSQGDFFENQIGI